MSPQYPRVQRKVVGSALTAGTGSLVETFQSASSYTHRTRDGVREWVGRRRRAQIARRSPPGRAPPPETS